MYKDTSCFTDDTDEAVQLVVDVGYIASRVRFLERIFPRCSATYGNYTTQTESGGGGGQTSLGTINQSGNNIDSSVGDSCSNKSVVDHKRRHIFEDFLIRIYEEHKRFNKSEGGDFFRMSNTSSEVQHNNDNKVDEISSTISTATINQQFTDDVERQQQLQQQQQKLSNNSLTSCGVGDIGDSVECIGEVGDNSEKKNGSAVVVVGSNLSGSYSGCGCSSTVILFNSDFSTISTTSITTTSSSATTTTAAATAENNVSPVVTFGANSLSQFAATYKLCDEDLRFIVQDLKRKIEYSETMNWLCLSRRPVTPPHRKSSLPKHTEVKKRFLEICDRTLSDEVMAALRLPAFDSYDWEDAAVIHLMQTMFIELGLVEKFNIPIGTLREWLYEVYKHYNEVPFHNFRHCFCVAQMMYAIARQANLISRLGELEVLILLVSCICHDLDHPGYNNIYQINARTELALRYNDISPLENHHCSIAFRLLEHPECNIFKNFSRESFNFIREGIIRCILATDMARHNEILTQFKDVVPVFDYSNRAHVNLLCMVLIKVADISNEARPMDVAEPWLDRLLQEFFAQSAAEKSEGLPVTPFMDPDKVSKPGSQVRFIGLVLLPLFEALGELLPDLTDLIIIPVRVALDYYKRLNDAQTKSRKSFAENTENSSDGGGSPSLPRSQSGISVRSRRSIPSQKSASRTSVDEPTCLAAELHDLPEGSESGDSETATEVDVAEKTSKFKVDTEGSNRSKSSHSTSRKSSREKRPSMISEMCSSGGRMRNSYGNIHGYHSNRCHFGSNRAVSLDQYSTNNRRLSDGLQQVISDSNVFYNRHNRSMDNDGQGGGGGANTPNSAAAIINSSTEKPKIIEGAVVAIVGGDDTINMNMTNAFFDNANRTIPLPNKTGSNSSSSNGNCSSQNGTKTWKARFKQITEMFTFGFEKNNKRFSSSARSSPCSIRNNNAAAGDLQKPGICCTISNNMSPNVLKRNPDLIAAASAGRNRAYSLDVPSRNRYSSSSGGGDSRKSSRNDENSCNRHDPFAEDNNSNHTSSGAGDMPTLPLPPHIRIGSSESTEPIGGSISDSRPKI